MPIEVLCSKGHRPSRCDCPPKQDNRPSSSQRGYDAKWRKTRKAYLTAHPYCETCGEPATDVHHLDGCGPLGPFGHDHRNLQALCHFCHSQETAVAQPGGWNR